MAFHAQKLVEAIREITAEFLARESGGQSLITVTRVDIGNRERLAVVYLTVLPTTKEASAIDFATRKAPELREFLKKRARTRTLPHFEFRIDEGEKNRQRIDEISNVAKAQDAQ